MHNHIVWTLMSTYYIHTKINKIPIKHSCIVADNKIPQVRMSACQSVQAGEYLSTNSVLISMHTRQWVIGLIPYRHWVQPALMKHIGLDVIWRALIAAPCGKEHMDHRAPLQHSWTIWPGHWAFYHHRGLSSWTAETSSCLLPAGLASSLSSGKTGKDLLHVATVKLCSATLS